MKRLVMLAVLFAGSVYAQQDISPVIIDYFYEPGCPECERIKVEVLPELEERFETFFVLNKHDVGVKLESYDKRRRVSHLDIFSQ